MPSETPSSRKLAAILFADIVGYTALMQTDEAKSLASLSKFKRELNLLVPNHHGEIVQFYGDGCLAIFNSSVDAVACANELQRKFQAPPFVPVRIGLHAGDVVIKEDNVFGDAVNIASRIESMGVPGSVLLSSSVRNQIKNQNEFELALLGKYEFKNVEGAMSIYALANKGLVVPNRDDIKGKIKQKEPNRNKWLRPSILAAAALGILFLLFNTFLSNSSSLAQQDSSENTIAVFPFDVKGGPDIQYLGEGIVDLVSTRLDEIPNLKSIDPNLVFSKLEKSSTISRKPDKAASLALMFGASQFIIGSIVEIDEAMQITASRFDVKGNLMDTESVEGNKKGQVAKTVDDLIKQLVAKELKDAGQEMGSLAAMTSSNLESLKAYLLGEQAFRDGNYKEAYNLFNQATELDTTFALAWMRVGDASTWDMGVSGWKAREKWAEYRHKMPQKWQDFYDAYIYYTSTDRKALKICEDLIRRYGEEHAFLNTIAEFLFHFNPIFGESPTAAKPWLMKSLALDENNNEALIHLGHVAVMEDDSVGLQNLLAKVKEDSEVYIMLKFCEMVFKEEVTDEEISSLLNHPNFLPEHMTGVWVIRKNKPLDTKLMERVSDLLDSKEFSTLTKIIKSGNMGKESANYESWKELTKIKSKFNFPYDQYQRCMPANLMTDSGFSPHSEHYEELYQITKDIDVPWETYAAIKYAIALGKEAEVKRLKEKLLSLNTKPWESKLVKHYDFSLKAFEARMAGENEKALEYVDSSYQYTAGYWQMQVSRVDKTIISANAHADLGNLEKAINIYENVAVVNIFGSSLATFGLMHYQLAQWYEEVGDTRNALIKCNLLIEGFKDCDSKYRPWVEETQQRKERLISRMN